ncbi:hypothetical protein K493DRAFT_382318 [Basidiobolus meristosporus CBS 931.73]|uniref:Uncharacterized protein n=1 Tax=Basidiobolus meristosporus CBS 931.73 TaxID=1314790 RepID=A0A1Y1XV94_9FUNG|nr:hypothetical protein K493DRAFT_382318 [Basidiobolus meristosporus CBS 931.73]|eukprot:ORX89678.1 hypothetical protein K493DRAFT_382318 [Basidiobolus meristosporus CBS 931.73]
MKDSTKVSDQATLPEFGTIHALQTEIEVLKIEHFQALRDAENRHRQEYASAQEHFDRSRIEYERDKNLLETQVRSLQQEKSELETQLSKALATLQERPDPVKVEQEMNSFRELIQSLRNETISLEQSHVAERERLAKELNEDHSQQIDILEREMKHLADQLGDTKQELQFYEKSLRKVLVQLSESRECLENSQVEKKDLEIRAVENEIAYLDLEEERDELKAQCGHLSQQLEILARKSFDLTDGAHAKSKASSHESLRQQYCDLKQDCNSLAEKIELMKARRELLLEEISELALSTQSLQNMIELSDYESDPSLGNAHLDGQVGESVMRNEELLKEIHSLEDSHEALEQHYIYLQKSIEELNVALSEESERVVTLQEEKKSLTEEIDELIQINEKFRNKADFWRNTVSKIESEQMTDRKRHSLGSENDTFTRIQRIYEQRLVDQQHRFNRLWDDIVTSNEHLHSENQNLQHQLGDTEKERDSWAEYAHSLQTRVEALSGESEMPKSILVTDPSMNTISHEKIYDHHEADRIPKSVLDSHLSALTSKFKQQIDALESDKQELINYATDLEYDVEQLTYALQKRDGASKRTSRSFAPPTPSESVSQESLLPGPGIFQEDGRSESNEASGIESGPTFSALSDFDTDGFATLFADIDQMRDEMTRLSQSNARLQEECRILKAERERLTQMVRQLLEKDSSVTEHQELLARFTGIGRELEEMSEADISKDPRVLELVDRVNRLELSLDNERRANDKLRQAVHHDRQSLTSTCSPILENGEPDVSDNRHINTAESYRKLCFGNAPVHTNGSGGAQNLSQNSVESLLVQSFKVKEMLETDSRLLIGIQALLAPDSIDKAHCSDEISDDSRSSSRLVDRDQVTRLFESLRLLGHNQNHLADDVQLIINHLQHIQSQHSFSSPDIVDITNKFNLIKLSDADDAPEAGQRGSIKGRDSGFSDGHGHPPFESRNTPLDASLPFHRPYSAFDTEEHTHQPQPQRATAELEELCGEYKRSNEKLARENHEFRLRLDEACNLNAALRQKSMMAENLELKIQDLLQIQDEEYAVNVAKVSQLETDLQHKINRIMGLTREKNSLLHNNHELQQKLIMISEKTDGLNSMWEALESKSEYPFGRSMYWERKHWANGRAYLLIEKPICHVYKLNNPLADEQVINVEVSAFPPPLYRTKSPVFFVVTRMTDKRFDPVISFGSLEVIFPPSPPDKWG